jgi:hypothetical protein
MPSPGRQISGMAETGVKPTTGLGMGADGASRRSPQGLPRAAPGASLASSAGGSVACCPRRSAWSGCARSTGCPTSPRAQDREVTPHPPPCEPCAGASIGRDWL